MISNSSPLIIFGRLNKLDLLLKVVKELEIAKAVYNEVVESGIIINAPESNLIKEYINNGKIKIKELNKTGEEKFTLLKKVYNQLDEGECETIALALQENKNEVLIDERLARKAAQFHGLKPCGSLRVLLIAYKKKIITEKEIKEIVTEMTSTKFRLSSEVINKFWMLFEAMKKNQ